MKSAVTMCVPRGTWYTHGTFMVTAAPRLVFPSLYVLQVAFLQETVRRECQEREDLIAALSRAQERLLAPQDSSTSPDTPTGRHVSPGNRTLHVLGRDRVLSRSGTSPNTLRASPAWSHTDGGGAGSGLRPRNDGGLLGGDEQQERTLPKLKSNNTVREVKPQGRGPGGALRMK